MVLRCVVAEAGNGHKDGSQGCSAATVDVGALIEAGRRQQQQQQQQATTSAAAVQFLEAVAPSRPAVAPGSGHTAAAEFLEAGQGVYMLLAWLENVLVWLGEGDLPPGVSVQQVKAGLEEEGLPTWVTSSWQHRGTMRHNPTLASPSSLPYPLSVAGTAASRRFSAAMGFGVRGALRGEVGGAGEERDASGGGGASSWGAGGDEEDEEGEEEEEDEDEVEIAVTDLAAHLEQHQELNNNMP